MYPQIPVGGRLQFFIKEWEKITDDKWVLSTIAEGLKFEFISKPKWIGIKETCVPVKNLPIILTEVESLLEKGAIEPVPISQINSGFYSTLFLFPKKTGDLRPIINLRPLNRYMSKLHFRMDTLTKVLNLVKPKDWAISLDLTDAYLHILIHKSHQKYLRFSIQGQVFQFPESTLFHQNYLSGNGSFEDAQHASSLVSRRLAYSKCNQENVLLDRERLLNLLHKLGFLVNWEKSSLIPSQNRTFIGAVFHFQRSIVLPTQERIDKLHLAIHSLIEGHNTAHYFLHLI